MVSLLFRFLGLFLLTALPLSASPPNVVVILTDDQGWGDLSLHGNTNLSTPNIDRLAHGGARFEKFYVSAVCSPTRAEFLTGRYHPRGGVYSTSAGGERLDLDEKTVADSFKAAGYRTGAFGKWHNGMQFPYHPNARGFDEFYGFCSGHWAHYFSPMLENNGELVSGNGFVTDDYTDKALAFMERAVRSGKPFFTYLPYNTPHSPMQVPDRYWEKFENAPLPMRSRTGSKEDLPHTRAALAMCENIDWNVGRLLAKLDSLQVTEDTIVVYFHDNGPNGWRWNGGMRGKKGSTDEGGTRSPLFIRWPGKIAAGKSVAPVAAAIDLLPTLAGLAGVSVVSEKPLDGISLEPLLTGEGEDWPARTLFSHWAGKVSARTDDYRLDHRGRLYALEADPGQDTDLAAARPVIAEGLQREVSRFREKVLSELSRDKRPFLIGHPGSKWTQIPARDAVAHGGIKRSSVHPNCSHFTDWKRTEDRITWDVEVVESGEFDVFIYYTCPEEDTGSIVELGFGDASVRTKVTDVFDPPYVGTTADRVKRSEGDEKDWKPLPAGRIRLEKGAGTFTLKALEIPNNAVMDFRLIMLERVTS